MAVVMVARVSGTPPTRGKVAIEVGAGAKTPSMCCKAIPDQTRFQMQSRWIPTFTWKSDYDRSAVLQKLTQSFHTHTVIVIGGVEDELLLEVKETPGLRVLPHLFVSAITTMYLYDCRPS